MSRQSIKQLLLVAILSLVAGDIWAQGSDDLHLKLDRALRLEESTAANSQVKPHLEFPHFYERDFYEGDEMKMRIADAESLQDYHALDSLLPLFVSNFGIRNFSTDVEYIWKAGQVKEILGDTTASLLYYELGLKNQKPYNERVKIHLDSLKEKTQNEWVNLKFYYKILEARRKIDPLIPPKGVMLNMGTKINSDAPDYAPFMHPSDSVLIFTSRREDDIVIDNINEQRNEDLYFSQRDFINGTWSYSEKFSDKINSEYNEGSSCLSPDGKTFYFTRCDAPDGMGSCDIYSAQFLGGEWTNVRNLGSHVNSSEWDSHPNISPDGKMLFFTSNRLGGFGLSDLYVCVKQEDGSFSRARNLGPTVNTVEDEVTPFFHQVNGTLYFSSTGHLRNMGGYDIFKSRLLEDHWESPKNVGPLVNTSGNEYYFSIDGKGTRLFYAKSKEGEANEQYRLDFDLYSFPMPMEARPDAIVTLRGHLIDSVSGYPITGIVLVIDKETGIEVAPKIINRFGYFEFDLINNKQYEIYVQGENFLTIKEEVLMDNDTTFTLFASSFQTGKPLVFESLEFQEDSYDLDASIQPKLDYIVEFLKRYPMFRIEVSGHTDSDGEAKYNLELSRKRSLQIRRYIIQRGEFKEERVKAAGYGESRPLVANDTEEHKKMNRRVEFEIWLDQDYKGPIVLPTEYEMYFDEELDEEILDPEFMKEDDFEFQWDDQFEIEEYNWERMDDEELQEFDNWGMDSDPEEEQEEPEELLDLGDGQ